MLRAFGLDLDADFRLAGVAHGDHVGDGRRLRLRLASAEEVARDFPADSERISQVRFDDGELAVSLDAAGDAGVLAYAADFGQARLSGDGRTGLVAPVERPPWVWQRYLTGQLLPLAALLQGLEVFHASVVGFDGRALAIVAASGAGKTTLALRLTLRGLDFLSDDVLVAEPAGEGVLAHPGIGLANVRPRSERLIGELERRGLGRAIGSSDQETRIALGRGDEPLPLGALFLLDRSAPAGELRVERLAPVDPRLLLASTFNFAVRTPDRLTRQLDVCSRIDRSAAVYLVSCGSDVAADDAAQAILDRCGDPAAASR